MAHLQVKVTNRFGTFEGKITMAANAPEGDEARVLREVIGGINSMEMLSIENEGEATVFGKEVLRQSVISVKAVS